MQAPSSRDRRPGAGAERHIYVIGRRVIGTYVASVTGVEPVSP